MDLALFHLDDILVRMGTRLSDFRDMYQPVRERRDDVSNPFVREELANAPNRPLSPEEINRLNQDQRRIFDTVVAAVENQNRQGQQKLFFVDGPGGTGNFT